MLPTNNGRPWIKPRPTEVSLDPSMLDAHRDNDHKTRWEALTPKEQGFIYAVLAGALMVFALYTAWVVL